MLSTHAGFDLRVNPVFWVPQHITSDQGSAFVSEVWNAMCQEMGTHWTTQYHPQSNGMIERWPSQLKDALSAPLEMHEDWLDHLPWVLLGLRVAPCSNTASHPLRW